MARIPEETIEEIRQQADIIDVISQYVPLKKSGKNYMAQCPFHEDHTPSFSVSEEKQLFHCFSCGRGGTIFTFLQEMEGDSFVEAVVKVAKMIHYPLDSTFIEQNQGENHQNTFQQSLLKLYEDASEFYHHLLMHTQQGKEAYQYLIDRGLTPETISTFKIGYSPTQRKALHLYLVEKNDKLKEDEVLFKESGLFSDYHLEQAGEYIDRFSDRIIFPIFDVRGQVIAFSGRVFNKSSNSNQHVAKYMNSPETALFNKSQALFNIHQARPEIKRNNEAILFEGYMDVIAAWQAGIKNGVATMGTALTETHLEILDRYTDHLILAFDGDKPGMEATYRTLNEVTNRTHFSVEAINFPPGDDPDEYIKKYGPQSFNELISHGRETTLNFYWKYFRQDKNLSNESDQLNYVDQLLKEVAKIATPIEKDMILKRLADEFHLSISSLEQQYQNVRESVQQQKLNDLQTKRKEQVLVAPVKNFGTEVLAPKLSVVERAEQMLLHRLFNSDHAWEVVQQVNPEFSFTDEEYQLLYILFQSYRKNEHSNSFSNFLDLLTDTNLKSLATTIMWLDLGMSFTEEEIIDYMKVIEDISPLKQKIEETRRQLSEAKRLGNQEAITTLSIEIVQLNQKLKNKNL